MRATIGKRVRSRYAMGVSQRGLRDMSGRRVKIGDVWDRTVAVLQGRAGILAGIALLFILLPGVVGNAVSAFGGIAPGARALAGLVSLAVTLLLLVGILAVTAVASDPGIDRATGIGIGVRRLGPAIACIAVLMLAAVLVLLPLSYIVFSSGATYNTATGRIQVQNASAGGVVLAGVLSIVLALAGLWISARLVPLFAVVVNERLGLRAITRSFALTRGATLRLIGVLLLYLVVLGVLFVAVTSVVGVVAGLLLGGEATAANVFVLAVVGSVLTTITSTVQMAFYAQYYVAARADDGGAPAAA